MPRDDDVLRATTSNGDVYDDPSEDTLFMLFADIDQGDVDFFIVNRLDDEPGQTYAQTIQDDNGEWIVERRDGSADAHFTASFPDLRSAHAAMTQWAFGAPVTDGAIWEKVSPG